MRNLPLDSNSRPMPVATIGFGANYSAGEIFGSGEKGQVYRFKAIAEAQFRLTNQPESTIVMNEGDTEYFYLNSGETVTIISGEINVMA